MSSVFQHIEYAMGTAFVFNLRGEFDSSFLNSQISAACQHLHEADRIFSLYKPESPLSKLARGETSVAQCEPVVEEVWQLCEKWQNITDGWFSPFTPQHTFDPSGLVKTWAAKQAAESLVAAGILDFTLNAGGDILISDLASEPIDWRVAVSKPVSIADSESGALTVLDLANTHFRAVATSGNSERGEHIWNPKSGGMAHEMALITVVAADLVAADIWATAAFAMGTQAIGLINRHNHEHPTAQVQALVQWPNQTLSATEGFETLFAKAPN